MRQLKTFLLGVLLILGFGTVTLAAPAHVTSFADIIEPLMPSVVNIYTVKYNNQTNAKGAALPKIIPFEQFNNFFEQFNVPFAIEELYTSPTPMSLGSGFIVGEDG